MISTFPFAFISSHWYCFTGANSLRINLNWNMIPTVLLGGMNAWSILYNRWDMMTSSNGNIFRISGHLCGKFTGPRWISRTKAGDAELWCFLWFTPDKRLGKQPWGWWFETPAWSLWRHRNDFCVRSRKPGHGWVIASHSILWMHLLIHAQYTRIWCQSPGMIGEFQVWINNHIHSSLRKVITHPCSNFHAVSTKALGH